VVPAPSAAPAGRNAMFPVIFFLPRPKRSSRLLLLLRPFMLIPLGIWQMLYGFVAGAVMFAAFWVIVITGRYPYSMWGFVERWYRFLTQIDAYTYLLTDVYPPFNGRETSGYPVRMRLQHPDRLSRLTVFFRPLILFPQFVFSALYGFWFGIIFALNFWAVLFLGRVPDAFWNVISGYFIYSSRVRAYAMNLVDEYPPFHGRQTKATELEFGG
jgi:hypothetical protein